MSDKRFDRGWSAWKAAVKNGPKARVAFLKGRSTETLIMALASEGASRDAAARNALATALLNRPDGGATGKAPTWALVSSVQLIETTSRQVMTSRQLVAAAHRLRHPVPVRSTAKGTTRLLP